MLIPFCWGTPGATFLRMSALVILITFVDENSVVFGPRRSYILNIQTRHSSYAAPRLSWYIGWIEKGESQHLKRADLPKVVFRDLQDLCKALVKNNSIFQRRKHILIAELANSASETEDTATNFSHLGSPKNNYSQSRNLKTKKN